MEPYEEVDTTRYYNTLGVRKDASLDQIKSQYRKLASREQPELGGDPVMFQLIKDAFNVLKDPAKRRLYDMYGESLAPATSSAPTTENPFNNMFGAGGFNNLFNIPPRSSPPPQTSNTQNQNRDASSEKSPAINVETEISLEDAYKGKLERVSFERKVTPGNLNQSNVQPCDACNGTGRISTEHNLGEGMIQRSEEVCPACNGDAFRGAAVTEQASIEVFFPKGVKSYEKFVFEGQGNKLPGKTAGDVVVKVIVRAHNVFRREGADLIMTKEIGLIDALSGINFTVHHLNGRIIRVKNEIGDVVKDKLRMTMIGYGMPFYHNDSNFGNLFIEFNINWPDCITSSQAMGIKQLFQSFSDTNNDVRVDETYILQRYNQNQENNYEEGGSQAPPSFNEGGNGQSNNDNERVQCNNQ